MIQIKLLERSCDCCGGNDLEEVWRYSRQAKTRNNDFNWEVRNVVCRSCGFAFVSPSPAEEDLEKYYRESYSIFSGQEIDYSIDKRMHVIEKYLEKTGADSYIEIGSNDCPEFLSLLGNHFNRVETVDLNSSCNTTYHSLQEIPRESADIIASYFALEHVPRPVDFLISCYNIIKNDGFIILEVPNLYLYPKDPSGLFLHEHVNHFSPRSLAALAEKCGLNLIYVSQEYCSRPFGFVAVFKKIDDFNISDINIDPTEFIYAKSCVLEGSYKIKRFFEDLEVAREKIKSVSEKEEGSVIVWCANIICLMLLEGFNVPPSVIFIDSDPRKKDYLHPFKVIEPKRAIQQIAQTDLLIINSKLHSSSIRKWIAENCNRHFSEKEMVILDFIS